MIEGLLYSAASRYFRLAGRAFEIQDFIQLAHISYYTHIQDYDESRSNLSTYIYLIVQKTLYKEVVQPVIKEEFTTSNIMVNPVYQINYDIEDIHRIVREEVNRLNGIEQDLVSLIVDPDSTLAEQLQKELHISVSRLSQLKKNVLEKLKHNIKKRGLNESVYFSSINNA